MAKKIWNNLEYFYVFNVSINSHYLVKILDVLRSVYISYFWLLSMNCKDKNTLLYNLFILNLNQYICLLSKRLLLCKMFSV